jgi:hypothetical protein
MQVFLHDYFIVVPEAVRVLEEREQLLANLRVLESDVADKQQQLARMEVLANQGQGDARRLANLRTVRVLLLCWCRCDQWMRASNAMVYHGVLWPAGHARSQSHAVAC